MLANNPIRLGGCLNSESAEKAARFVRLCDAFGIPLIVVTDVPGYLPGVGQEWEGVVRRGAKLLHAFAEARVPRVTLVTRKIYGGAYIAMNARSLGATAVYAWPGSEVAVMGAKAAVGILHKKARAARRRRSARRCTSGSPPNTSASRAAWSAPSRSVSSTRSSTRRRPAAPSPRHWPRPRPAPATTRTFRSDRPTEAGPGTSGARFEFPGPRGTDRHRAAQIADAASPVEC
ncbi:carboxyl transferase domain-containing protein [Nocardia abscessus]|uniref:carboxyl transferase domain-containing protein n=1 Tax=Nocardia abscessus TaxID=120957 RepID=UPI003555C396